MKREGFHFRDLHLPAPDTRVPPYLTALAGFRRVEAIPGTSSVPAAGVTLRDTPFFDDSVVPVVGGAVVLFTVSSRVRIGVEGVSTSDEGRICPISDPLL